MRRTGQDIPGYTPRARNRSVKAATWIACLGLVAFISAACSESGDVPETAPLTPELQQVLEQVASIRELPQVDELEAGLVPRSEMAALVESQLTEADREGFERLTVLYRLLGHLGPTQDYLSVYLELLGDAGIGFYSVTEKRFFLVGEGERIDFDSLGRAEKSTIAHEFIHALQDEAFDLEPLFERVRGDLDWGLALNAVVEGDAVVHERLWATEYLARPGEAILASIRRAAVPASIEREIRFPYDTGSEWVGILKNQGGIAAIDELLSGRRITTAEILHPELYSSGWTPAEVTLPDVSEALGGEFERMAGGSFGEFQVRNYLQLHLGGLQATLGADGWLVDRYDIYVEEAEAVAVFRIRFTSSGEAQQFMAEQDRWFEAAGASVSALDDGGRLAEAEDGRTTIRPVAGGDTVLFVIATDRALAERSLAALAGG